MRNAIGIGLIFTIIAVFIIITGNTGKTTSTQQSADTELDRRIADMGRYIAEQERLLSVKLSKMSWKKGGFDSVMIVSFTLENTNSFPVKDVEVTCEGSGNSGTLIDINVRTIYDVVKAKSAKPISNFNMGLIHSQASKSWCRVSEFKNAS
jgi:hypothetical protein